MVYTTDSYQAGTNHTQIGWGLRLLLLLFVIVCIFDPADLILGRKTLVFAALWAATLLKIVLQRKHPDLPPLLIAYVAAFIAIPLMSIGFYYVSDGSQPFEGFTMLKGYLLISLALVLVVNRIDLLPILCAALTVLACLVIVVFVAIKLEPDVFRLLKPAGDESGLISLDRRNYGDDVVLLQVYFVTSPMLAISIAYYLDRAITARGIGRTLFYLAVMVVNIAGMFLAGSRNNILISLLLPFLLWPFYTNRPLLFLACSLVAGVLAALPFVGYLSAFLDPTETANSVKLAIIDDYILFFSDPWTLLFGQGLGAYRIWSGKAVTPFVYITELTFLEMFRNFGLIGGVGMLGLLLFPAGIGFFRYNAKEISLGIAWLLYLVMCFSNPNLFSSMGILILSVLVANIFIERSPEAGWEPRNAFANV